MSGEVVARVARAILDEQLRREDDDEKPTGWDDATPSDHDEAFALARIAISALREPTGEMVQAIYRAATAPPHPRFGDVWTASDVWQAGIDEALR